MTAEISESILEEAKELIMTEAPEDCPSTDNIKISVSENSVRVECPGVGQPVCDTCPLKKGLTFSQRKEKE